jgi:hypothetical protein
MTLLPGQAPIYRDKQGPDCPECPPLSRIHSTQRLTPSGAISALTGFYLSRICASKLWTLLIQHRPGRWTETWEVDDDVGLVSHTMREDALLSASHTVGRQNNAILPFVPQDVDDADVKSPTPCEEMHFYECRTLQSP